MGDLPKPDCSRYATEHKGHRYYFGGPRDGKVDHLVSATPSDFPMTLGSHMLLGRRRNWYEIDYDRSDGTEVAYRFIGDGKDFPQRAVAEDGGQ
jgi:hypothetical protein